MSARPSPRPDRLRLVLLTALWRRHELAGVVLRHYGRLRERLAPRLDLRPIAVGSEGDASRRLAERAGFDYVEAPNRPLSEKWNLGLEAARGMDPDGVAIVGSDDLLSAEVFLSHAGDLRAGHPYVGLSDLWFLDLATLRLGRWDGDRAAATEPIGCGRCFGRELLRSVGWRPWPDAPRNRRLDHWCTRRLRGHGFRPRQRSLDAMGARGVDLKSSVNLNRFDALPLRPVRGREAALEYLRALLPEPEVDRLLELAGSERAGRLGDGRPAGVAGGSAPDVAP